MSTQKGKVATEKLKHASVWNCGVDRELTNLETVLSGSEKGSGKIAFGSQRKETMSYV